MGGVEILGGSGGPTEYFWPQQIFLKAAQRLRNGGAKATYRLRNGCGKGEAAKPRSRKSEATEGREVHNVVARTALRSLPRART